MNIKNSFIDTFPLKEGDVILQYPARMSIESFEFFKEFILLELRRLERKTLQESQDYD